MGEVTTLLERLQSKDRKAVDELFALLYDELRRLARSRIAVSGRHTLLDTSSLLHEAYLRLQQRSQLKLSDKQHFLAYAASTLRSIVIDYIRQRGAERHGGAFAHVTLNTEVAQDLGATDDEVLQVNDALLALAEIDPRLVQVVEMRYFAGLTETEIAAALEVSDRTVRRDWERARLLLGQMLRR